MATATACALNADKIIFLMDGDGVKDSSGELIRQLNLLEAEKMIRENSHDDMLFPENHCPSDNLPVVTATEPPASA